MNTVAVYGLSFDRSRQFVERFLNHFAPVRSAVAEDYEYPQYAQGPEVVYKDDKSILDRLADDKNAPYSIYWDTKTSRSSSEVEQIIAVYTDDGAVLLGVVVQQHSAQAILENLRNRFGIEWGLITGDECPPASAMQFQRICNAATLPHIARGNLLRTKEEGFGAE